MEHDYTTISYRLRVSELKTLSIVCRYFAAWFCDLN